MGLVILAVLASCTKADEPYVDSSILSLSASVEQNTELSTKVGFTAGEANFFWTKGDKIGVQTDKSGGFQAMTLDFNDKGKANGIFSGSISGTPQGYAIYPYGSQGTHSMNGSTLTYNLPASYSYSSLDSEYANEDGNSHNMAMWGSINGSSVSFKHLGGVLAFVIEGLPQNTSDLKFTLNATNKINGTFTADLSQAEPVITTSSTDIDSEKSVSILFSTEENQTTGHFYIPVPVGEIGNLSVVVTNASDNELATGMWDNKEVERKDIIRFKISESSLSGGAGEVKSVSNVSDIDDDVLSTTEDNLSINVSNEVSGDNTILIPADLATETTTFSFASVSDNATIKIENAPSGEYGGKIIIEVPEDETIPNVEANVPDGEVYIKQGNITTLVVSSADNTTIIGDGVTVDVLTVNKGNVRIMKGGSVGNIERGESNDGGVTYIIYEGTIPSDVTDEELIKHISAAEWDLKQAAEKGGTYTLNADVVITNTLVIPSENTFALDLNGYTISQTKACTASYSMIENRGSLTISGNGKISFIDNGAGDPNFGWGSYTLTNYGTLVVEDATIENLSTQNEQDNVHMYCAIQQGHGAVSTTINSGVISTPTYRSVRINVGALEIKGGEFIGQVWLQPNQGDVTMKISGGEFSPCGNDKSSVFMTNVGENYTVTSANISGGKFNTKIGSSDATKEGVKGSVKGGIFTETAKTDTAVGLIAEGYNFEANTDGTYTLAPSFVKTSETSYIVYNLSGLKAFRDAVNGGNSFNGCTVKLAGELNLSGENWIPIGTSENPFQGTFDGGFTIKNLNIVETEAKEGKAYTGFFGYANNATIKNVTFENVNLNIACLDIDHSQGHIGAVAGSLEGTSTIENVTVCGDIKVEATFDANGASRVAVVAGGNSSGNVTMREVHVKANEGSYLKANNNVGALAGQLQVKNVFENCSSNIDVTGKKFFAGGIIGLAAGNSTFTNCHTTGDVTVTAGREGRANDHYRVGGIAGGWADGSNNVCTLTDCSYTGKISGTNADGSVANPLDYAGYVGRGYTLTNCAGSKVIIDGTSYVQADNKTFGIYIVNDVYEIGTAAALRWIANEVNAGNNYFTGKTVKMTNDIDLNNEEWIPIGSAYKDHGFCGNFDGNNKTIKNLKISNITPDSDGFVYAALFGVTEGTETNSNYVKNLNIENVNISAEGSIVSAAIAYPYYTTVENITVRGNVSIQGGDYTSGVLAYTRRCVDAKNLIITANSASAITGNNSVGGVISDIQMNGGLTANYSNFKASGLIITGNQCVGGISGIIASQTLDGATVENVSIKCQDVRKGSVAGALGGKSTIKNISVANVTGAENVVGATYDGGNEVVANGDVYEAKTDVGN